MDTKTQGAANAASPLIDSLQLIARDAATYAEGAGEPEFSQFLNIEARILAMVRVKASLEPCTNILADALERVAVLFTALADYTRERKSPKDTAILTEWLNDVRA